MSYRLSRKAEEDLIQIFIHGMEEFGVAQAENYHAAFERQFRRLSENPRMGRERNEIKPPVRVLPLRSHIIIYLIDGEEEVFVVRIRHMREDWEGQERPPGAE